MEAEGYIERVRNILINFADENYRNSQVRNSTSALMHGFDSVHQYSPKDIDGDFYSKNKSILDQKRGCGYWLWKPYFILKNLESLSKDDILFYSDSGADIIKDFSPIIEKIRNCEQGVCPFSLSGNHKEFQYTKRDLFVALDLDNEEFSESKQIMASFIGFKKTDFSINFCREYLKYAQIEQLITDSPSKKENYKGFKDHRHDQSIFSLLCKKNNLPLIEDPTQWGQRHKELHPRHQFIWHRRNNNSIKVEPRNLEGVPVRLIVG